MSNVVEKKKITHCTERPNISLELMVLGFLSLGLLLTRLMDVQQIKKRLALGMKVFGG